MPAEARIASGVPNDTRDFSDENATALARRCETLARYEADKKAKKGRREASVKEIFDALATARQQIAELVEFVGEGRLHHLDGLLRLLRLTIADRTARPLSLLQHCASITNSPLLVFAPPISANKKPLLMAGIQTLAFPISSVATDLLRNEVDLDVWLDSRAAQLEGRVLSQSELLNNIASSVAAHFDTQVREEADTLRSWRSEISGVDSDFLAHYALAISSAARDISEPNSGTPACLVAGLSCGTVLADDGGLVRPLSCPFPPFGPTGTFRPSLPLGERAIRASAKWRMR